MGDVKQIIPEELQIEIARLEHEKEHLVVWAEFDEFHLAALKEFVALKQVAEQMRDALKEVTVRDFRGCDKLVKVRAALAAAAKVMPEVR